MDERFYDSLELNKILEMLSKECSNEKTKKMALGIKPCSDLYTVKKETGKTAEALELSVRYGTPNFYNINDVSTYIKRAEAGGVLSLGELIQIRRLLAQTYELHHWHEQCENKNTSLSYLFEMLYPNKYLQQRLETAIIDETKLSDDASAELRSIRQKITRSGLKIRETLDKMIKSPSTQKYLQESIVTMRDGRFVLPVKTEFKGNVSGLVHDTSATGSTLFIEPMSVVEANNDIRILQGQEQDEIHRIIAEFSMECAEMKDQLISNYNAVTELNLYFAKANLGAKMRAMLPEISNDGVIVLNKARHPLIDPKKVVPINFSIGTDYHSLIITGPNTGGKTVTLKTIGLLTLMAMCGLLVPCADNSELSVFRRVLVDIGDEQSIEQSLSTFSGHMTNIVQIIKLANAGSLCLIDELGAGTDPVEGAALAIAILERLRDKHAKIASTTHYAELKEFALRTPGVENGSCEFDVATLKPTYRLLIGVPGKSNAFAISKRLGIDDEIISRASELVSNENRQFEDVVEKLEKHRQSLEKQLENANRLTAKANTEKQKAENEMQKAKQRAEREIEKARQEAQRIISRTRAQADAVAEELEKAIKAKDMSVQARTQLKKNIDKMEAHADPVKARNTPDEEYKLPRPLKVGDTVLIYDIDKNATVLAPPNKDGVVLVQAGIIKTRVDIKNLRLLKSNNKPAKDRFSSTRNVPSRMDVRPETEVDVRGETAFDAINIVDKAIDNAVLSGVSKMTIIHGKGTGVLKREINKYLKTNKAVKSQRLGVFGEGEDGVTIIELK